MRIIADHQDVNKEGFCVFSDWVQKLTQTMTAMTAFIVSPNVEFPPTQVDHLIIASPHFWMDTPEQMSDSRK